MFAKNIVVIMISLMLALLVFGIQYPRVSGLLYADNSLASKFGQMCKAEQEIPRMRH